MKAIILAAGYNTRLERDLSSLPADSEYRSLRGLPKPLLPLAGKPLLEHLLKQIKSQPQETYIVTNAKYYPQFIQWAKAAHFPPENIVNDGTATNEERCGAIMDLLLTIRTKSIEEEVLVVAGDLLLPDDFQCQEMQQYFHRCGHSLISVYPEEGELSKRGVVEMNARGQVQRFLEKPAAGETSSRWASPPLYFFRQEDLNLVEKYLDLHQELALRDAPGHFLSWLCRTVPVFTYLLSGRYDVGDLAGYLQVQQALPKQPVPANTAPP